MLIPVFLGYTYHSGNGVISGNVIVDGLPRQGMRVHLIESNVVVRSTITDATGQYSFEKLNENMTFDVMVKDPLGIWESKVSSRRTPLV